MTGDLPNKQVQTFATFFCFRFQNKSTATRAEVPLSLHNFTCTLLVPEYIYPFKKLQCVLSGLMGLFWLNTQQRLLNANPVTDALTAHALTYADTSCFSVDWIMLRVHEYRKSHPWIKFADNGEDQENYSSPASVRLMILMPPRHFVLRLSP